VAQALPRKISEKEFKNLLEETMNLITLIKMFVVSLVTVLFFASSAASADRDGSPFSDRSKKNEWEKQRNELTRNLKTGEDRDFYRKELEKLGYQITSVNHDKADYVEYEVVKGKDTFEIEIDIDKNTHKATKVDVASNMWMAETTDQMLKGKQPDKKKVTHKGNARFSDRDHRGKWEKGKDQLVQALKTGEERDFYRRELNKLGYKITSVNTEKPDYLEYEVVKGDQTYEIQIDLDKNSHKANKVDIDTNVMKAKATEKALKQAHQRTRGMEKAQYEAQKNLRLASENSPFLQFIHQ